MNQNMPMIFNGFNCYKEGNRLIGVTEEVSLPELTALTETMSGAGLLGEIDVPAIGHYSAMEQEIPFQMLYGDIFTYFKVNAPVDLTMRGSMQVQSAATGNLDSIGLRVVERGMVTALTPGSVKQGAAGKPSVKFSVTYIYIEVDGLPKFELDKLNGIFRIDGQDQLAKIRANC